MKSVAEARVWSTTAHGEISVVRPVAGLELLSLRGWNRPWSGSLAGLGLVIAETSEPLAARVAGIFERLGRGSVLFVPANEHYSLEASDLLTASILSLEPSWLERVPAVLGKGASRRAWIARASELDAALRRLIARVAADGPNSYEAECAQVMLELSAVQVVEPITERQPEEHTSKPPRPA